MSDERSEVVLAASAARANAYVPYSKFAMGAAARAADGTIVQGALVENVSLGLAMCAERVALFALVALGLRPTSFALVAKRTDGVITTPCGACLQVALELGGPATEVISVADDGEQMIATVGDLLPHGPRKRP
jgi:homotetrameric cytidine deaminase